MAEDNGLGVEFKYLIVNDMDRKFGLWVNTLGYQSIPPDSPYPLKEHSVSKKQDFWNEWCRSEDWTGQDYNEWKCSRQCGSGGVGDEVEY